MVAPISANGAYGISALSAYSFIEKTQKVDPAITQEIKDAESVAKTARSLSDRVEPVRPNAKNDGTWVYVQSQNMGLPGAFDIEGLEANDSKIVIDLKGFNIPESFEFKTPYEAQDKNYKEAEEEVVADVAQEYVARFQEIADENMKLMQAESEFNKEEDTFDNFFANQFFGLNSYSQNIKAYESQAGGSNSFVA